MLGLPSAVTPSAICCLQFSNDVLIGSVFSTVIGCHDPESHTHTRPRVVNASQPAYIVYPSLAGWPPSHGGQVDSVTAAISKMIIDKRQ